MPRPVTVSQMLAQLKGCLRREPALQSLLLRGELSSLRRSPAGHLYFLLKDRKAQVRCVMFASAAGKLRFAPEDGVQVLLAGTLEVYDPRGDLQVQVQAMRPDGVGTLFETMERIKRKLAAEGLFESARKRSLPFLPQAVGLVTSLEGAVLHDVFTTLRRRNPAVELVLAPASVQGPEAPRQVVLALRALERVPGVDCVIVARGGGSMEDLMAFNSEPLVRAVAACKLPVISAVGHETDVTLCDLAADCRAPTPTAAAELAAPARAELSLAVEDLRSRLRRSLAVRVERQRHDLVRLMSSPALRYPERIVEREWQRLDDQRFRLGRALPSRMRSERQHLEALLRSPGLRFPLLRCNVENERQKGLKLRLLAGMSRSLERNRRDLEATFAQLGSLSPDRVLERGYAICLDAEGRPVQRAAGRKRGETLEIRLIDGRLDATIDEVRASTLGPPAHGDR
ncbi:MAG: exodeoxyribonuclease VII large subunit [Armatimonadetes bacterium]|nr:exodeoxyribonuclease VII large subunit [Armatimonadota bacterium]